MARSLQFSFLFSPISIYQIKPSMPSDDLFDGLPPPAAAAPDGGGARAASLSPPPHPPAPAPPPPPKPALKSSLKRSKPSPSSADATPSSPPAPAAPEAHGEISAPYVAPLLSKLNHPRLLLLLPSLWIGTRGRLIEEPL